MFAMANEGLESANEESRDELIMSHLLAAYHSLITISSKSDGFGSASIADITGFALERITNIMVLIGCSESEIVDLEASLAVGEPGPLLHRWKPYAEPDCPANLRALIKVNAIADRLTRPALIKISESEARAMIETG